MNVKLTLSMNKEVIERAKRYAEKENKSLSQMVEGYFSKLSADGGHLIEITPLVKKLSKVVDAPVAEKELKKQYAEHLLKKYSK